MEASNTQVLASEYHPLKKKKKKRVRQEVCKTSLEHAGVSERKKCSKEDGDPSRRRRSQPLGLQPYLQPREHQQCSIFQSDTQEAAGRGQGLGEGVGSEG